MNAPARNGVALVTGGIMMVTMLFSTGPAGAASNKEHLLKAWVALENDYKHIAVSLQTDNKSEAESGFIAYSRDCIPLATFETSFNATISSDIFSIAKLGNAWAWIGYITLDSNSSVTAFKTETGRLVSAIDKFNRDLSTNGL